jgi:hypothetical protein
MGAVALQYALCPFPPFSPPLVVLFDAPFLHRAVVAVHEFSHAATGFCTGAKIKSITLDPREGGCTYASGGSAAIMLPAGYVGSSAFGALLIFSGFDIVASKVASIVVGVIFLLTLYWGRRDWLYVLSSPPPSPTDPLARAVPFSPSSSQPDLLWLSGSSPTAPHFASTCCSSVS